MAAQDMRVTNLPDSGSPERVALDMARQIASWESDSNRTVYTRQGFLDLYRECLVAARGLR